jgi:anti-sigma factor RsiW
MTTHLSATVLNALVDGELSIEQSAAAKEHLDQCPSCTSSALSHALLKTATAKAGQRYAMPPHLQERLRRLTSSQALNAPPVLRNNESRTWPMGRITSLALPIAAMLIVLASASLLLQRYTSHSDRASMERAALVTEVSDLHIATLADSQPPEVISSDRHTVKPWFQGKLPFSFNLPDNLPADTRLEGANLTYLHNRPVAQLLYRVGQHRVSVFIQQPPQERSSAAEQNPPPAEYAGFHLTEVDTSDLEILAVSDVDPSRLTELVHVIEEVQTRH